MEACKGSPQDPKNEFQFVTCHLNLPTAIAHDPWMPRVMLLQEDDELATTKVTYVDDIHLVGRVKEGIFNHVRTACK